MRRGDEGRGGLAGRARRAGASPSGLKASRDRDGHRPGDVPSFEVAFNPIVEAINAAYQQVRGKTQPTGAITPPGYGTDAAHLYRMGGMPGVVCGPGGRYNTMPDERVDIVDYLDMVQFTFLRSCASAAKASSVGTKHLTTGRPRSGVEELGNTWSRPPFETHRYAMLLRGQLILLRFERLRVCQTDSTNGSAGRIGHVVAQVAPRYSGGRRLRRCSSARPARRNRAGCAVRRASKNETVARLAPVPILHHVGHTPDRPSPCCRSSTAGRW